MFSAIMVKNSERNQEEVLLVPRLARGKKKKNIKGAITQEHRSERNIVFYPGKNEDCHSFKNEKLDYLSLLFHWSEWPSAYPLFSSLLWFCHKSIHSCLSVDYTGFGML